MSDGWDWGDWLVTVTMVLLLWATLLGGMFAMLHYSRARTGLQSPTGMVNGPARQELDLRFARGEIGEEEYRRSRDLLEGFPPAAVPPDARTMAGRGQSSPG